MADDGHVLLDALGRRIMRDDGSLDVCEECCYPCLLCGANAPDSITVVFSDIDFCECQNNGDFDFTLIPGDDPNTTFVIDELTYSTATKCVWRNSFTMSSSLYKQNYDTRDCSCSGSETGTSYVTRYLSVSVTISDTGISVSAYYRTLFGGYYPPPIFDGSTPNNYPLAPCTSDTYVITNDIDNSYCGCNESETGWNYGGQATVSW